MGIIYFEKFKNTSGSEYESNYNLDAVENNISMSLDNKLLLNQINFYYMFNKEKTSTKYI